MKDFLSMEIAKKKFMDVLNILYIANTFNQMAILTFHSGGLTIKTTDADSKISIRATLGSEFLTNINLHCESFGNAIHFSICIETLLEIAREAEEYIYIDIPDYDNKQSIIFKDGKNTNRFYGYTKTPSFPEYTNRHNGKDVVVASQDVITMSKTREPLVVRVENGKAIFEKNNTQVLSLMIFQGPKTASLVIPMETIRRLCEDGDVVQFVAITLDTESISSIRTMTNSGSNIKTIDVTTVTSAESTEKLLSNTYTQTYSVEEMDIAAKGLTHSDKVIFTVNGMAGTRSLKCILSNNHGTVHYVFFDKKQESQNNFL